MVEKEILRWIDKIYPSEDEFFSALNSRKLVIYHGVDPTGPQLHLGHSTNYLLLEKLRQLGHKIILLIGDFTAQVGDPTGKSETRKPLTKNQIKKNFETYKEQTGKILDFKSNKNPVKVEFNSKWLKKMNAEKIIKLASHITHGRLIKRNMFQERIKGEQEIYMHEFIYPLLQGYDSVALDTDVEVGGTDQTFNMLIGRDLMKFYRNKEKFVITTPLLENPKTGKKLMSKSEGSFVALNDKPNNMYGKIMALPDETIISCLTLCTEIPLRGIGEVKKISKPRDQKARLAFEIVKMYHGEKEAQKAQENFSKVFSKKEWPSDAPKMKLGQMPILDLIVIGELASSKSEAKRLVDQGAVKIDGVVEKDWKKSVKGPAKIQVGPRRFLELL